MRDLLARIAGWCVERPRPCWPRRRWWRWSPRSGRWGSRPTRAPTSSSIATPRPSSAPRSSSASSATTRSSSWSRATSSSSCSARTSASCWRSRRAWPATPPGAGCSPTSRPPGRAPRWPRAAGPGGHGAGDLPQPVGDPGRAAARTAVGRGAQQARAAAASAALDARRQGLSKGEQRAAAQAAAQEVMTAFQQQVSTSRPLRADRDAAHRRSDLRPAPWSSTAGARAAEGAVLPVPERRCGPDLGPLAPRLSETERREAIEQIRDAVADPAFRSATPSTSSAASRSSSRASPEALRRDLRPARGRARGDGAGPGAALGPPMRLLPLGIASPPRPRCSDCCCLRRLVHHGVARGAADLDRARGRLRDPVSCPVRGGARAGASSPRAAVEAAAAGGRRHRRRRHSPPPRASSSCCSRRSRWSAGSACCS